MNDEQIVKALECCINDNCGSCPDAIANSVGDCERNLRRDALDLINRQKAENKKLREAIISKNLTPTACKVMKENDEKHIHIINGLEAEIARLKADKVIAERHEKDARELFKNAVSEIEQWKEEANKYQNLWCEAESDLQKAKSEAVKEFAKELEKYKCLRHDGHEFVDVIRIRLLLEEMVGESDAT